MTRKRLSPLEKEEMLKRYLAGEPERGLVREFGVGGSYIRNFMRRSSNSRCSQVSYIRVGLSRNAVKNLEEEAGHRNVSKADLVRAVLQAVFADNLFAAVLDV